MEKFFDFLILDLKRSERTAMEEIWYIRKFLKAIGKCAYEISKGDI